MQQELNLSPRQLQDNVDDIQDQEKGEQLGSALYRDDDQDEIASYLVNIRMRKRDGSDHGERSLVAILDMSYIQPVNCL